MGRDGFEPSKQVAADVHVNECGENFLYDDADGTKSFSVEFFEFEHDTL